MRSEKVGYPTRYVFTTALLVELLLGCLDRFGQSSTIRQPTSPAHAASFCVATSTPSSLPDQDRQQLSSATIPPRAVQPEEPTPGPAPSRLALVHPPSGAMTRPGNKTFAEAFTSYLPATSSSVTSDIINSVFLKDPRTAEGQY
ncbi:hypothetical protein J6590_085896 [Homalodisca vitripennis]|nr:hypothetical protein J6590_085896 [Homalodisca vitripennis]